MVSHSRVKRFLWLLALIVLLLSLLPASPGPPSAAPNTPVPNVQTYSLVEINGQLLDASKSPPAPAVLSHTPKPFLPWFRELETEKFPGPEYVNVSAEAATYLTDKVLWSFRAVPTQAPGLTIIHFTWTSPRLGIVGVATFVVINTGPSPEEGSHEIRHLFNGIPLWTISGPGWQTSLRTFEGISFGGDKTHLGTWSLTQDVNGARTTTPFFVRAMGVQNLGSDPTPYDPNAGPGTIKADIVGEPVSPDPASWAPEPETTWKLTVNDFVTPAALFTYEGTGTTVRVAFDGRPSPEVVAGLPPHVGSHIAANLPLPPGRYPLNFYALAPDTRTDLVAQGTVTIHGANVSITLINRTTNQVIEPTEMPWVFPSQQVFVRATVTTSAERPVANEEVRLTATAEATSGGHDHTNLTTVRPTGLFANRRPVEERHTITGRTSALGNFDAAFQFTEFGGEERLTATLTDSGVTVTLPVDVGIPGLGLLSGAPGVHVKVGGTCAHHGPACAECPGCADLDHNHWGRPLVLQALREGIRDYLVQFAAQPQTNPVPVNDISFPRGGRFDLGGQWSQSAYHVGHRNGNEVDLNTTDTATDGIPPDRRVQLEENLTDAWMRVNPGTLAWVTVNYESSAGQAHFHATYFSTGVARSPESRIAQHGNQ